MKRNRKFLISLFFLLFSAISQGFPAAEKETLESINKKIKEIGATLKNLQKEKNSILNDIYAFELRYEREKIESNKIKMQLQTTQQKIDRKETEITKLEKEISKSREHVKNVLRTLHKIPGNLYLVLVLRVQDSSQLFKNYGLFKSLIKYQAKEISKLKANMDELDKIKKSLLSEQEQIYKLVEQKEQKLRQIRILKQNKLKLIRQINTDGDFHNQMLQELQEKAKKLNEVLQRGGISTSTITLNLKKIKGTLNWPIDGKIISQFGRQRSTRFDTYTINNGIEIKPSKSDRIKAIFDGEVIFCNYFKGYGNLIIIQHSKNFLSMYGHCSQFHKKKGDRIKKGETIALAGDTGSTLGNSLYFEIREKLKAKDPVKWLKKR